MLPGITESLLSESLLYTTSLLRERPMLVPVFANGKKSRGFLLL